MRSSSAIWYRAVVGCGYLISAAGGIWLGLFSCGGYRWHKDLAELSLLGFGLAIAVFALQGRAPARLLPALGLLPAFLLFRSLAAPFYLGFNTLGEYASHVGRALSRGPC